MGNPIEALPDGLRRRLQALQADLVRLLGDNLVALLAFGSAARGEFREGTSDVDLVVVLREATPAALEAMANPLQVARNASRIEAMVLVADEIGRSADVFPLFYDDLRSSHVVLHGQDPFATLTIADHHRRLRVEQELREASIRLRRAVIDASGARPQLVGAIERKIKQIRGPMRALLTLHGQTVGVALPEVMAAAGAYYKVDVGPFSKVRADPTAALTALQQLLNTAIDDVDRMEVPSLPPAPGSDRDEPAPDLRSDRFFPLQYRLRARLRGAVRGHRGGGHRGDAGHPAPDRRERRAPLH